MHMPGLKKSTESPDMAEREKENREKRQTDRQRQRQQSERY